MTRIPTVEIEVDGRRKIVNADDPRAQPRAAPAKPEVPDREAIATMPKGEVREWLDAHNVEVEKGANVEEMRAALIATMFVEA